MDRITFSISGLPGTYATAKEAPWKKAVYEQAPRPSLEGKEIGLRFKFILPTLKPGGQPLDVDNLCEPVFSVLINQVGWFDKSRSNLQWWQATKEKGVEHGCRITVHATDSMILSQAEPDYDEIYTGQLPTNARSRPLGDWAWKMREHNRIHWIPHECSLFLGFPTSNYNIGNIGSNSIVKPTIDCLYPWLGGQEGSPDDHRVMSLAVSKSHGAHPDRGITIKLWTHGRDDGPLPVRSAHPVSSNSTQLSRTKQGSGPTTGVIVNPCIPGSRKWIVCEGALAKKMLGEVQSDLENAYRGSGKRIKEYISDLRGENRLDIRVEEGRLVCLGHLY